MIKISDINEDKKKRYIYSYKARKGEGTKARREKRKKGEKKKED
jgi:hypothetical protein